MNRSSEDEVWGELRSLLHLPSAQSWLRVMEVLSLKLPYIKELEAYVASSLATWPDEVTRVVPEHVLVKVLEGEEPPDYVKHCNALCVMKKHRHHGAHIHGLIQDTSNNGRHRLHDLLRAFSGQSWRILCVENIALSGENSEALVRYLKEQKGLRMFSLANNNIGKRTFSAIHETGCLSGLSALSLDGNTLGKAAMRLLFSNHAASPNALKHFSWGNVALSHGAFRRIVSSPWFCELHSLQLENSSLGVDGGRILEQHDAPSKLKRCVLSLKSEEPRVVAALGELEMFMGLETLCVHFSGSRYLGRLSLAGEMVEHMIHDASWSASLREFQLTTNVPIHEIEAIGHRRLPKLLRKLHLSLNLELRLRQRYVHQKTWFEQVAKQHPDVECYWDSKRVKPQGEVVEHGPLEIDWTYQWWRKHVLGLS